MFFKQWLDIRMSNFRAASSVFWAWWVRGWFVCTESTAGRGRSVPPSDRRARSFQFLYLRCHPLVLSLASINESENVDSQGSSSKVTRMTSQKAFSSVFLAWNDGSPAKCDSTHRRQLELLTSQHFETSFSYQMFDIMREHFCAQRDTFYSRMLTLLSICHD